MRFVLGVNDDYIFANEDDEPFVLDSYDTFDAAVLGAKHLAMDSSIWKIDVEERDEDDRTLDVTVVFLAEWRHV